MIIEFRAIKKLVLLTVLLSGTAVSLYSQQVDDLLKKVKAKLELVSDYKADGILKTDVPFMKVPESNVIVFYKKPDKFRIKKQEGISIVPKGGISINLNSLFLSNDFTIVPSGNTTVNGIKVVIIKLLPTKENSDVVLSTLYIDETEALIRKATTTTKNSGTYEMEMFYGKFAKWALPDKILFSFDTKDYKLPKGVTFEYETGEKPPPAAAAKNQKGRVEIIYSNYTINKGLPDSIFNGG